MKLNEFFERMGIDWDGCLPENFVRGGDAGMAARKRGSGRERRDYARGLLLYQLVKKYRSAKILEIGTGRGYGTFCMSCALVSYMPLSGTIITIDTVAPDEMFDFMTYPTGSVNTCFSALLCRFLGVHSWRISYRTVRSAKILPKLKEQFDLVFIDGSHKKKDVATDIDWALKLSQKNTVICLHDYKNHRTPEVTEAIDSRMAALGLHGALYQVVTEGYPDDCGVYEILDTDSCTLVCLPRK